ncbi:MAG: LamG domain-containing protein, partial [Gelidibacter sp.]
NAGTDVDLSGGTCNVTITGLNATPLAAAGLSGVWTVTSGQEANSYSFSDPTDPKSTFHGQSGESYTLSWTLTVNDTYCSDLLSDEITVTFASCEDNIVFDGVDDFISFGNNYSLTGSPFSIEVWIKTAVIGGTQTILSKRDTSLPNTGYDLTLANNVLQFNYNNASVRAAQVIDASRWYHVAVTFNGAVYNMFIDGINVRLNTTGTAPAVNGKNALIGAVASSSFNPINYFNGGLTGGLDEIRFWNVALSTDQIRLMMNQEIKEDASNVIGSVTGTPVASGLTWASLSGYYQMNQLTNVDISNGNLNANNGSPLTGKLMNMTDLQAQTAPLPYVSTTAGGNWTSPSTWQNGNVQMLPNSNGVNGTPINWNIVRTRANINSTNKNITILGLFIDSNILSVANTNPTDGQSLTVTKYLNIGAGAVLDLVGESQLLQPEGSIVGTGTGILERDQQGTGNMFNYNYWGSPVSTDGTLGARTYDLRRAINDGNQQINWIAPHTFLPTSSPVSISTRWLYTYKGDDGDYDVWNRITPDSPIDVGVGFIMKGSGINTATDKNYTFKGQPNSGTIIVNIGGPNQAVVIGNPYPSAIDA